MHNVTCAVVTHATIIFDSSVPRRAVSYTDQHRFHATYQQRPNELNQQSVSYDELSKMIKTGALYNNKTTRLATEMKTCAEMLTMLIAAGFITQRSG